MKKGVKISMVLLFSIVPLLILGQSFERTVNLQKFNGFFDFFYDDKEDKILLKIDDLEMEFLYVHALSSGVGSNDIGLDRGQLGNEQVVYFKRAGNKLLLIQPNYRYRAITKNLLEKQSVEQAFAKSVLHGFTIIEEYKGSFLIDFTPFLMRDAHGVANRLKNSGQGDYKLDLTKSALAFQRTKAFPKNVEFDVLLTFAGNPEGDFVESVVPNPSLITVAQHHSLIQLPDDNYEKRAFDPRSGCYKFSYLDYATPVHEPIEKRHIPRHRLKKKDPNAEMSEAVEPIVYYLDNGTPEPIRSALLDGARWWNQAFTAIGYKNAFQIKILPDDADPLDIRYNVIQWVHRSTRGWSYGASILDPRTGEIVKGHVSLGSLRIRQDFLIAQALMNRPFVEDDNNHDPMLDFALARIRQLSAHEIGHTLGFTHNFAASTKNRSSVMDYPHFKIDMENGGLKFSDAYASGIGDWDKVTVAYAYSDFPKGTDEKQALEAILKKAQSNGLRFLSNQDALPMGSASPIAHVWDNGSDAAEELERVLKIREIAISNFSKDNIQDGQPYSLLEDVFVPLYFFHRYQLAATAKVIGGIDYNYKIKNDGQLPWMPVSRSDQEKALKWLLKTLNANTLSIPEDKLKLFPPRVMGYPRTRESFKSKTGVAFDVFGAAETAASMTLAFLLHPERANRLVQQTALDKEQLGFDKVIKELVDNTIRKKGESGYLGEIKEVIDYQVLQHLMQLGASDQVYPQVKSEVLRVLRQLPSDLLNRNHLFSLEIGKYLNNPSKYKNEVEVSKIPDGSPIGMDCLFHFHVD